MKEKKLARRRAYSQREDVKVRQRAYMKEYFQRDDVKEKRRAYLQREDVKERTKIKRIARAFAAAYGVSVDDLRGGSEP